MCRIHPVPKLLDSQHLLADKDTLRTVEKSRKNLRKDSGVKVNLAVLVALQDLCTIWHRLAFIPSETDTGRRSPEPTAAGLKQ